MPRKPVKTQTVPVERHPESGDEPLAWSRLAALMQTIATLSSRNEMQDKVVELIRSIRPSDLTMTIFLLCNKIANPWEDIELNLGDALIIKALAQYANMSVDSVKARAKESGDLSVCIEYKPFRPESILLTTLWQHLHQLSRTKGKGSVDTKVMLIHSMMCQMPDPVSFSFYIRVLQQNVRTGLAEKSVLSALAQAFGANKHSHAIIEKAVSLNGSIDRLVSTLQTQGLSGLQLYSIEPLSPVSPMLAKPSKSIEEVFEMTNERNFVVEYKYDGERMQLHILKDRCESFSRSMERSTDKFSDFVRELRPCFTAYDSLILDGEIIALDVETRQIQSFQTLSLRKQTNVSLCYVVYDILYCNGASWLEKCWQERRAKLESLVDWRDSRLMLAASSPILSWNSQDTTSLIIEEWLDKSIEANCEGLMVKCCDDESTYEPNKRSNKWLKMKKDYLETIGDTLDLVVIGAWMGKGKRTSYFGSFLVACYNEDTEDFETVARIGTGLRDVDLEEIQRNLYDQGMCRQSKPLNVQTSRTMIPDVYIEPKWVWEIKCADMTLSSIHTGGKGQLSSVDKSLGIGLRFPRFVRGRADKTIIQATTSCQVAEMYSRQFKGKK